MSTYFVVELNGDNSDLTTIHANKVGIRDILTGFGYDVVSVCQSDFDPDTQIMSTWSIEDVQSVRPDLSDDQAMEVLGAVEGNFDANQGINWFKLEYHAEDLFGKKPDLFLDDDFDEEIITE